MGSSFAVLEELSKTASWGEVVASALGGYSELPWGNEDFGTHWIVAGHRVREQVADDPALVQFLRILRIILFRCCPYWFSEAPFPPRQPWGAVVAHSENAP